ncbi:LuxR C-terminal-related transcriptional regulator [Microbacterium sp. ZW T5_56]|uniref:LuxR C-terminal-related transcriptional regulator n=1 Tax=Microbacterium sp. ZW T5_56 TaxID=3378081 RepID=UPI0038534969
MDRRALIAAAGTAIVTDDADAAAAILASEHGSTADAMRAFAAYWSADYAACALFARRAQASARDPQERAMAMAATLWARAGGAADVEVPDRDTIIAAGTDVANQPQPQNAVSTLARAFLADSALMIGRLDIAQAVVPDPSESARWRNSVLEVPLHGVCVRVAIFSGRIDQARVMLPGLREAGERHHLLLWPLACEALVAAMAGDVATARDAIDALLALGLDDTTFPGRGALMLAAYAAAAAGDEAGAASLARRAGGHRDLSLLAAADRAMAVDLLVADAISRDDEREIIRGELLLADLDHTALVTLPTLLRTRARILLHRGDTVQAATVAEASAELAGAAERRLEHGDARIIAARALLHADLPAAARLLRDEVRAADAAGEHALRERAARVLAAAHRRLPPPPTAWVGLSPREREVLDLLRAGHDEDAISDRLHLERSTVHRHLARAMSAFGSSGRVALLSAAGATGERRPLPELTARQRTVTELMSTGITNAAIAEVLGVSSKAVEAHLTQVMLRCEVPTRLALAHRWLLRE